MMVVTRWMFAGAALVAGCVEPDVIDYVPKTFCDRVTSADVVASGDLSGYANVGDNVRVALNVARTWKGAPATSLALVATPLESGAIGFRRAVADLHWPVVVFASKDGAVTSLNDGLLWAETPQTWLRNEGWFASGARREAVEAALDAVARGEACVNPEMLQDCWATRDPVPRSECPPIGGSSDGGVTTFPDRDR